MASGNIDSGRFAEAERTVIDRRYPTARRVVAFAIGAALVGPAACSPAQPTSSPTAGRSPVAIESSSATESNRPTSTEHGDQTPIQTGQPIDIASLSGRIVFDDSQDIWSMNADGTGLKRLTRSAWREFEPTMSPDGRSIVYRSETNDYPELWIMNADGSGQRRLTPEGGFPAWSPDGSMIAYAPPGGPSGRSWISIMNADGSGQRRLPDTDYGEYPSWSPDGKRIAFTNAISGERLMYIVDVDGSRVVDLSSVGEGTQPAWSPDGRSILFASQRDHSDYFRDVYAMRPDGSGVRRLTHAAAETPAWSPDGRYIIFSAMSGFGVMRAGGSAVSSLPVEGVAWASSPDWR